MSFARTLIALGLGFAAAKGVDRYRKSGGMEGMKDALRDAGAEGGMADQIAQRAEKLGLPVDSNTVRSMADKWGKSAASMTEATESNLGTMIGAVTSAAHSGMNTMTEMFERVTAATGATSVTEGNARLMIRAMIAGAKADGEISAEERNDIMDKLGDASDEEIAFVQEALDGDIDLAQLAADAGDTAKEHVYTAALLTTKADTDGERTFLANLAKALKLDAKQVAKLHDDAGIAQA